AMRAISGALRCTASQPVRIFSVTGTSTAPTTASRIRATSSSSRISAEPAQALHTFFAGQPMLMSMMCAPCAALWRAASAMAAGSVPAICTLTGSGSPAWSMRCTDLRVFQKRGSLVVISDTASPAPSRLHSSRNGLSVTPAIGARTTFGSMAWGPMRIPPLSQPRRGRASGRRGRPVRAGSGGQVGHRGAGRVGLDRLDAVVARRGAGIHLAVADDLAVGGLQVEVGAAVLRGETLEVGLVRGVPAHRLDAVERRGLLLVALAGKDHLAVAGLQVELEFAVLALADFELAGHVDLARGARWAGMSQPWSCRAAVNLRAGVAAVASRRRRPAVRWSARHSARRSARGR